MGKNRIKKMECRTSFAGAHVRSRVTEKTDEGCLPKHVGMENGKQVFFTLLSDDSGIFYLGLM